VVAGADRLERVKTAMFVIGISLAIPLFGADVGAEKMFRNPAAFDTVEWLPNTQPDARIRYAPESSLQFGDLRIPDEPPPPGGFPVAIFIHGGAWRADWSKDYSSRFVEALTRAEIATWDLEFRRMGNRGGGYPGTFLDVGFAADYLRKLAETYPLNIGRAVAVGHSSGGHLALWLAGRKNLPATSSLYVVDPLPLTGVVSLAGVNDLEQSLELGKRTDVLELLGVDSQQAAGPRFAETNPRRLLPFGIPQVLIVGTRDNDWRIVMTPEYAETARAAGDEVDLELPEGADHVDVVDPEGPAVEMVAGVILALVSET
jgi:acetyl esterase/lipase